MNIIKLLVFLKMHLKVETDIDNKSNVKRKRECTIFHYVSNINQLVSNMNTDILKHL